MALTECGALTQLLIDCAACCGEALCGDFGSAAQQRYMHLGGVSPLVAAVERVALQWKIPVLVDARVHADVETNWNCRLYDPVVYAKRGDPQPLLLWGVCGEKEEAEQNSSSGNEEWMYQLDCRARMLLGVST